MPFPGDRYLLTSISAWAGAGVLLAFFDRPLWDRLWILTFSIWAVYALAGLVLFFLAIRRARRKRWPRAPTIAAVAIPVLAVALWFTLPSLAAAGDQFWFQRRFHILQPQYKAIIQQLARAAERPERGETAGITFQVDSGAPLRVAFPQPGGIIDNWEGVVYDPTGAVASATGWRAGVPGNYSASPNVVNLFGGDLVQCQHVEGRFYRCWFT